MNQNYEKIKRACQIANPKLMELSLGCEVKEKKTGEIYYFLQNDSDGDGNEIVWINDPILSPQRITSIEFPLWYEILGHEPQLSDVLMAYRATLNPGEWKVKTEVVQTWILDRFDLSKSVKDQSEETLQFIADLL